MVGFDLTWVLAGLLLIPYLVWGVYLLTQRLVHDVELDRAVETFTVVFLTFFYVFEFTLMKAWLENSPVKLVFAVLALTVSGFALYGPMLVSFAAHLMVDLLLPTGRYHSDTPRYGNAEGFELRGDYEGAAREYIAIARQFPKEVRAPLAAADNLAKIGQPEAAAPWFEAALELIEDSDEALKVANRLVEIYDTQLGLHVEAREVLEEYLQRFPASNYAESVQRRIDRMKETVRPAPAEPEIRDTALG